MGNGEEQDRAGSDYWNRTWRESDLPQVWPVESHRIRFSVERRLFEYMEKVFGADLANSGKRLVEVGCARSGVLPLFAAKLGFSVSGLDYSAVGCEQTRMILKREGVAGDVYCCDVFKVPADLIEQFDVVVSFGLIEHFTDTDAIVEALSRLVRPGGVLFTSIPNMNGLTGFAQRVLDRSVYRIHVPLTVEQVRKAHERAGLDVEACEYFMSTNFAVCNLNGIQRGSPRWWLKKAVLFALARSSMAVWWCEKVIGEFPAHRLASPYINCVARTPERKADG